MRHVTFDRINAIQTVYPCPFCGSKPIIKSAANKYTGKAHSLLELTDTMETVFRKTKDSQTWHFHEDCASWPSDDYIELEAAPRIERLCDECRTKASDH